MGRATFTFLALFVSLWPARAEAAKVIITRPASESPALSETLSRLKGEMLSLGLEVAIAERPAALGATDSRAWVERIAAERDSDAVIDLIADGTASAIDIWVFERRVRRFEVSRVAVEPNAENAAERQAIRAVEALRSSLVEIDLAARERRSAPPAPVPTVVAPPPPRNDGDPTGRIGVEAGAALLTGVDGVGPALVPILRLDWAARSWLLVQAEVGGLGSRPTVTSPAGSARIAQQHGLVGAAVCTRCGRTVDPYVGLAAGVLRTAIDGDAVPPGDAHAIERWSFLLDGSVGTRLRLPGRYSLTLAAHVQIAEPYIAIHLADTVVATSGRPNILLSLTVGAWL